MALTHQEANVRAAGVIILTTQLLALVLRKIRQPKVIAEVIGGILLGMCAASSLQSQSHDGSLPPDCSPSHHCSPLRFCASGSARVTLPMHRRGFPDTPVTVRLATK